MKIAPREAGMFLKQPDKQARAALIYGPDAGLVRERSQMIASYILGKNPDPLNRVELTGAQIKADPAILADELNSFSLMGGQRVVILRDPTEKIEPVIKEAFEDSKTSTYLVVEAGDLGSSSSLRKLFEKETYLASVACYLGDENAIEDMIHGVFAKAGVRANHDAMMYLVSNLGNDRAVTQSELEKIVLYMGDEKEATLPIVSQLTGNNAAEDIEDLCHSLATGTAADSDKLYVHLLHEDAQPVAIVRSLIKYFQRLDLAFGYMQSGSNREDAIKMLRPPVFFKSMDIIRKALTTWDAARVSYCLNLLLRTEREIKSGTVSPALVTSNTLVAIAGLKVAA